MEQDEASRVQGEEKLRLESWQRALFESLNDIDPELGRTYLGVVRVLADPLNPARAYQAAHMARDICDRIDEYMGADGGEYQRPRKARLLNVEEDDPVVRHWIDVRNALVGLAHLRGPGQEPPRVEDVVRELRRLEDLLAALLRPFYERFEDLDRLLAVEAPTQADIQTLLTLFTRRGTARRAYFFDNLNKSRWLKPLHEGRLFSNPPKPIRYEQEGTIAFPRWPESEYLVRLAAVDPKTVHEIILQILDKAEENANPRVLEGFVDAALAMPADLGADISRRAKSWDRRYYLLLPSKLGALMSKMADGGEAAAAIKLASWVLAVHSDERGKEGEAGGVFFRIRSEPRTWMRDYDYSQIIQEHLPSVLKAAPSEACDLVCKILQSAVRIRLGVEEGPDYSYIWLPAIESHESNIGSYDIKEILTFAARDALECWAGRSPEDARPFIERLLQHPYSILRRLGMHVIRVSREHFGDLAARVLSSREFFDDHEVWHEYFLLLRTCFGNLSPEQQGQILGFIEKGPDPEAFEKTYMALEGRPPSPEEVQSHCKDWTLRRVAALDGMLPEHWQEKHDRLVSELGKPDHPDFMSYSTGAHFVGPSTPKTREELADMPLEDLIAFLQEYDAPSGPDPEDTPRGLGETLGEVVKENPKRYAEAASGFAQPGIRPTYLYHLLYGLEQAWKAGKEFPWEQPLSLCHWVANQQDQPPAKAEEGWFRITYGEVRGEVANLLGEAVATDKHTVDPQHMPRIRDVLLHLIHDPDPTTPEEEQSRFPDSDPYTVSINVVRGKAMHALVTYALRYARLQDKGEPKGPFPPGHRMEEEVKSALTEKLDKSKDPSPAVQSIFGRYLANLFYLDWEWTEKHLDDIFPAEPDKEKYWEAAWGAYLCYGRFFKDLYPTLKPQYRLGIEAMNKLSAGKAGLADPAQHVGHHLMAAYWHGLEELEGEGFLLPLFYENASDDVRSAAIWSLADGLEKLEEIEEREPGRRDQVWARLRGLWESRIAAANRAADNGDFTKELSSFARWLEFAPEGVDTLSPLIEPILPHVAKQWHGHLILEYLGKQAESKPLPSVRLLLAMVAREDVVGYIVVYEDRIQAILRAAMDSGDEEARTCAVKAINLLGERGQYAYRDLLPLP